MEPTFRRFLIVLVLQTGLPTSPRPAMEPKNPWNSYFSLRGVTLGTAKTGQIHAFPLGGYFGFGNFHGKSPWKRLATRLLPKI
jgi:hypothetical protein